METGAPASPAPRPLPLVTGDPALNFANTVDDPLGPARHDHVAAYPALLAWGERVGLLGAGEHRALSDLAGAHPTAAARALHRAHHLRDVLNAVFPVGPDLDRHWTELRPYVGDAVAHLDYRSGGEAGQPQRSWPLTTSLDAPLWPIAYAAHELLTGADLARVKQCAACPWLFIDHSKNGSRRWCDMNDCGKNEKMRRYVDRRARQRRRRTDPPG